MSRLDFFDVSWATACLEEDGKNPPLNVAGGAALAAAAFTSLEGQEGGDKGITVGYFHALTSSG